MNYAHVLLFTLVALFFSILPLRAMEEPEELSKDKPEFNIMDIPSTMYSQSAQESKQNQEQEIFVSEINDKEGYLILTIKKENGDLASYKVKLAGKEINEISNTSNPNLSNDLEAQDVSRRAKIIDFLKKHGYIAPWGILTSLITFNVLSLVLKYIG